VKRSAVALGACTLALGAIVGARSTAAMPPRPAVASPGLRGAAKGPEGQPFPYGAPTTAHRKNRDKAYDLVGGRWSCRTFGGTAFSHQYSRGEDAASLIVSTDVKIEGKPYTLKERYQYHRLTQTWSVTLAGGQFAATAGRWLGRSWVFSGVDSEDGHATPATMTYDLDDGNTFRRTFERAAADGKKTYTGERCVRAD